MIDVRLLQKNFDETASALMRKKVSAETIAELGAANEALKAAKTSYENAQAKQNELSRLFGQYKKEGKDTTELKTQVDANKALVAELLETQRSAEEALDALEADHAFLLKGNVFTQDVIETWLDYKRKSEVDQIRLRPHPYEFALYYDV